MRKIKTPFGTLVPAGTLQPLRHGSWANAHAVRDQHEQEVTQLESSAFEAAAKQVRS